MDERYDMGNGSDMSKRPAIEIYVSKIYKDVLNEILCGIEEEGLLYNIVVRELIQLDNDKPKVTYRSDPSQTARGLAAEAAESSVLNTGIGVFGYSAAVTDRRLKGGVVLETAGSIGLQEYRCLGANAARLVKKMPLRL